MPHMTHDGRAKVYVARDKHGRYAVGVSAEAAVDDFRVRYGPAAQKDAVLQAAYVPIPDIFPRVPSKIRAPARTINDLITKK